MGTEKDPEHEDKTGSNPLRQGCPTEEALRRGFTLVYLSRTVRLRLDLPPPEVVIFGFRSCTGTTAFIAPSELVDFVGALLSRTRGTAPIYMLKCETAMVGEAPPVEPAGRAACRGLLPSWR